MAPSTGRRARRATRDVVLAFSLTLGCSFYTDCPCANQPAKPPATAGTGNATGGGAGKGTSGGAGGTGGTGGVGGSSNPGGEGGAGGEPVVLEWTRATSNLAGRSVGCGNLSFMSAKPDENLLLASVSGDGLWATDDGGGSWHPLGAGKGSALIQSTPAFVLYDPDAPGTFWVAGIYGPGLYRSDDDGDTFRELGTISHNDYVSVDFSDPDRKLILTGGHEQPQTLKRSLDGGESWEDIGMTLPADCQQSTFPVILDRKNILLGCRNEILASSDGGDTWEVSNAYGGAGAPLITASGVIYWMIDNNGGLVKSDDGGQSWQRLVGGGVIASMPVVELPDGSVAAMSVSTNEIMRSDDDGMTWKVIAPALPYKPSGFLYSEFEGAFFAWESTCEKTIPKDVILRFGFAP